MRLFKKPLDKDTQWDTAREFLGPVGRLLSPDKSAPEGRVVVWNGNVCTRSVGKIWYGDIDITDPTDLRDLATELGEPVYVLNEMDARFDTESEPVFSNARLRVKNGRKVHTA